MKTIQACRVILVAAGCVLVSGLFAADQPAAPPMTPEEQAMMQKWQAFATPGDAHQRLATRAGTWDANIETWEKPGAPPQTSTGTSTMTMIMDGRYLFEEAKGSFMGQPFMGQGTIGYDNMKKKYVWTWVDTMGTGVMTSEGTYNPGTKTTTYRGQGPDVMAGKYVPMRTIVKDTGPDTYTMEMYGPGPDGKEFKSMRIDYTRRK